MALVGNTFYQDSSLDPGAGYPMYYWNQTNTGLVYIRDAADSGWVLVGDSAQPYLGQLSTQGGNMNGAVTGAHGLSPADTNDFTTSLYERGLEVATLQYVNDQVAILNATISTSLATALATLPTLSLSTKVKHETGVWNHPNSDPHSYTINLPVYTDGIQAVESECIWGAYLTRLEFGQYNSGTTHFRCVQTSNRVFEVESDWTGGDHYTTDIVWWIIAFRSQS